MVAIHLDFSVATDRPPARRQGGAHGERTAIPALSSSSGRVNEGGGHLHTSTSSLCSEIYPLG